MLIEWRPGPVFMGGLRFHEHIQQPLAEGTQGGRVSAVGRSGRIDTAAFGDIFTTQNLLTSPLSHRLTF